VNATSTAFEPGNSLIVCAQTEMDSLTGLFGPIIDGRAMRSKTLMRIEQDASGFISGEETPTAGESWSSWCTDVTEASP